jgi:thymidylate kinase
VPHETPQDAGDALMWHPRLGSAFRALDQAGLRWCLLRPPSDRLRPTGDVDLLVHPLDRGSLFGVLGPLGFARVPDAGSPDTFFLSYDQDTDCWLLLQFATRLSFSGDRVLPSQASVDALGRRTREGDAWWLRPEDEFWTTLAHVCLDKDHVPVGSRARLAALAREAAPEGAVQRALAPHLPDGWGSGKAVDAVLDQSWTDLDTFAQDWRAAWPARRRLALHRAGVERTVRLARGLLNPWRRRGPSVALLGPDGAGKSSLAAGLAAHAHFPTRTYYMDVKEEDLRRAAAVGIPGLTFAVYITELWRRLLRARLRQARGEVVLFDRYFYDVLNGADQPAPTRSTAVARWVHTHLLPATTLGVVLDVPGELAYARKGERSVADLEEERARWLALARRLPHFRVVDATQPAEVVRRQVTAAIWAEYARRWTARTGGPS